MSPPAAYSFAVVCEAPADRDLSTGLADRVLCDEIEWTDQESLNLHRQWRGLGVGDSHLEWHWVPGLARQQNLRAHGHFRGEPGALDAAMARKALLLLARTQRPPDAVVLVRDTDGEEERKRGLEQARTVAPWPFQIVLGLPHTKRECWILAGFDPRSDIEEVALTEMRRELGFDPRLQAENLTASERTALRSAKRVLERLLSGNREREEDCWSGSDLASLIERGRLTGLADYLDEVRSRLVPIFSGDRNG
jgi:hypothetical protein